MEHTKIITGDGRILDGDAVLAAFQQAIAAMEEAVQVLAAAFAQIAETINEVMVQALPWIRQLQRNLWYARLSEHYPGWLARRIIAVTPDNWLPPLRC